METKVGDIRINMSPIGWYVRLVTLIDTDSYKYISFMQSNDALHFQNIGTDKLCNQSHKAVESESELRYWRDLITNVLIEKHFDYSYFKGIWRALDESNRVLKEPVFELGKVYKYDRSNNFYLVVGFTSDDAPLLTKTPDIRQGELNPTKYATKLEKFTLATKEEARIFLHNARTYLKEAIQWRCSYLDIVDESLLKLD